MKNLRSGVIVNIKEHIILQNFWEYFVTDTETGLKGIIEAVVMGFEIEIGDVSLYEIGPYIVSRTRKLKDVAPATGWEWIK